MAKERGGVHNDCATIGDMLDDAGELRKKGLSLESDEGECWVRLALVESMCHGTFEVV